MIEYIDEHLDEWAKWVWSNKERLGYSNMSPEYRMMTENAATTKATKRKIYHVIVVGGRTIKRDIDPMPCTERRGKRPAPTISDNPIAEAMDKAISHLRSSTFKDAIRLKYLARFDDKTSAGMFRPRVSRETFIKWINIIHYCIDSYLRDHYPELVRGEL